MPPGAHQARNVLGVIESKRHERREEWLNRHAQFGISQFLRRRHILRLMAILFWLSILLVCIFAEIHTQAFVALFVGIGAIVAFFLALASVPFAVEAVVFVVVTALTLLSLRPTVMRRFEHKSVVDLAAPAPSSLATMTGFVEVVVGDEGHPGRVKIKGETWRAVTDSGVPIDVGTQIVVKKAYGTTLWVEQI